MADFDSKQSLSAVTEGRNKKATTSQRSKNISLLPSASVADDNRTTNAIQRKRHSENNILAESSKRRRIQRTHKQPEGIVIKSTSTDCIAQRTRSKISLVVVTPDTNSHHSNVTVTTPKTHKTKTFSNSNKHSETNVNLSTEASSKFILNSSACEFLNNSNKSINLKTPENCSTPEPKNQKRRKLAKVDKNRIKLHLSSNSTVVRNLRSTNRESISPGPSTISSTQKDKQNPSQISTGSSQASVSDPSTGSTASTSFSSDISGGDHVAYAQSNFTKDSNQSLNLGSRLTRSSGGANRDAPQNLNSISDSFQLQDRQSSNLNSTNQTNSTGTGTLSFGAATQKLRRSSRGKTGSCVSNTTATSHGIGSGGVAAVTLHPLAGAGATTSDSVDLPRTSTRADVETSQQYQNYTSSTVSPNSAQVKVPASGSLDVVGLMAHQSSSGSKGGSSSVGTVNAHVDSESDDSEVGRLQALLEARGLPPHLFGALGPRMTHILHRTIGNSTTTKAQQLLSGLQSQDESQQLQAAIEMCQMLVMGNEDTLSGFPIKQVVPALIVLLRMEHNFDIMNNACRALAYMLEALPRSSGTVIEAVPVLLEKLQVIQCMDVAEQSLTALEILSRRHNKAILQANGISACLTYLDFFSINAQRAALTMTSNCCLNLHTEEFHFVTDNLSTLARLLSQKDKKSVESVCTSFCRLVESFQNDTNKLKEIATKDLLKNCQQLLIVTPPILNTGTFTSVIRMLSVMCGNCPELATSLLKSDIATTLLYLLTGSMQINQVITVQLVSRSPSELYEITCLIGELMPRLPSDGIFSVDSLLQRSLSEAQEQLTWQWRDDRGNWHSYSGLDSRMVEAAHTNSEDEISLTTLGRTYTIDFHTMQQINDDTGTTRPVQRKLHSSPGGSSVSGQDLSTSGSNVKSFVTNPRNISTDARICCLNEERELYSEFIKSLFNVLYEVYSSSAGPAVRYKCLRALLRMVYHADADLLKHVLKSHIVPSHIAGMMASNDLRIVVGALQMAEILMQKLPDVFKMLFRREGVIYQISLLADPNHQIGSNLSPRQVASSTDQPGPSSAGLSVRSFNFDMPGTSKSQGLHFLRGAHLKSVPPLPTTEPTYLQNVPSTSSANFGHTVQESNIDVPINTYNRYQLHSSDTAQTLAQSLPNNGNFLLYTASDLRISPQNSTTHMTTNQEELLPLPPTSFPVSETQPPIGTSISSFVLQNKVSDKLKRKVPPKRKSQYNRKTLAKSQDPSVQELSIKASSSPVNNTTKLVTGSGARPRLLADSSSARPGSSGHSKTSFLSSLNPVRWGRQSAHQSTLFSKEAAANNCANNTSKTLAHANLAAGNRDKAKQWIRDEAKLFIQRYSDKEAPNNSLTGAPVLIRLCRIIDKLQADFDESLKALTELKEILIESDISPFEVNHSGLIKALITFTTIENGLVPRESRLRVFLHVFAGLPIGPIYKIEFPPTINPFAFNALVEKLNACVTQLEQFPVKVHDFPAGRSNTSVLKFFNTHQLKCNLQRHPDCNNLRQWKGGTVKIDPLAFVQAIERYLVVRGYGGIRGDSDEDSEEDMDDNVAAVVMSQSTLKHRLQFIIGDNVLPYNMTVYQAVKQFSPLVNYQTETDTDTETPMGNASIWVQQHTIYYRPIEEDNGASSSKREATSGATTSKKEKGSSKHLRKKTAIWHDGIAPTACSPLQQFLVETLPANVTVQDASSDALCMLRIMNALNRHWEYLYGIFSHENIIAQNQFVHSKITAKANRQLQDPLVLMTGNLPQWLQQIAVACPFLFPFETRHLLFYAVSFDRDRALQRLLDSTPDFNAVDSSERVTPRFDRRKRSISRDDILKQAEQIIQDFGHSKALLEIQYENEVGTGLGPTLEFYALVSSELQRANLNLWNDNASYKTNSAIMDTNSEQVKPSESAERNSNNTSASNEEELVNTINGLVNSSLTGSALNMIIESDNINNHNHLQRVISKSDTIGHHVSTVHGLFPFPVARSVKLPQLSRVKSKFKFLGKFMAKAVMDSRMLDLPFSLPFYRWLLNEESTINLGDLSLVAPEVQRTLVRLHNVVCQRDEIQSNPEIDEGEKTEKIDRLDIDGCSIVDLGLDFSLPGHANIELRRGGKDIPVTIQNLHQYISLVTHWFLVEGVQRQFESLREGFESVFPAHLLRMFYPEELENIFCGSGTSTYQQWNIKMLQDSCRTDHGFTQNSQAIQFLYEILSSYDLQGQRHFLQFVTGSPRLPTGGFRALTPPLTIVRKTLDNNQHPNDYLPSVMTCVNYLKLPEYTSLEVMRAKLQIAAMEGTMSFHLS